MADYGVQVPAAWEDSLGGVVVVWVLILGTSVLLGLALGFLAVACHKYRLRLLNRGNGKSVQSASSTSSLNSVEPVLPKQSLKGKEPARPPPIQTKLNTHYFHEVSGDAPSSSRAPSSGNKGVYRLSLDTMAIATSSKSPGTRTSLEYAMLPTSSPLASPTSARPMNE
jgi:hypothetical protein